MKESRTEPGSVLSTQDFNVLLEALNITALVSMTDAEGTIIYANDKFVEVSKYSHKELIGQDHRILKSGHQPQELFETLWKTISSGQIWRGEIKNRAKDGSYYWVDTNIVPIIGPGGKPERYIAIRFLITDRKKAELELRSALGDIEKFKLALENSYESIVITDTNGTIQYVNGTFSRLTGYSAQEAIGQNPRILQSGKTSPDVYEKMWSMISNGETFTTDELINKRKDGTEYYADIAIFPVMQEDKPQFFVAMQRNVTERKLDEFAKSQFVSVASHQLRTPVTGLRLSLELLLKGRFGALTAQQREILEPAYSYAINLAETIRMMLAISRIESGNLVTETASVELCPLLADLQQEHEFLLKQKNLTMTVECAGDITIETDKISLHEIVANLMSNAIRYTPVGGSIRVSAKQEGDAVRLEVADTGIGIPLHLQEKVFQKFFRAENARKTVTDGTGLGLFLVHSLVTRIRGTISFVSKENTGTTFTIMLPLTTPSHGA